MLPGAHQTALLIASGLCALQPQHQGEQGPSKPVEVMASDRILPEILARRRLLAESGPAAGLAEASGDSGRAPSPPMGGWGVERTPSPAGVLQQQRSGEGRSRRGPDGRSVFFGEDTNFHWEDSPEAREARRSIQIGDGGSLGGWLAEIG